MAAGLPARLLVALCALWPITRTGLLVSWTGSYCHLPREWFWRHAWSGHVRDGKVVMQPGFAASEIDTSKPHPARMYDAYLGGNDNYPVDREAVREIVRLYPEVRPIALANRAFLQRAVRFLVGEAGIRQFLDIGTGIPSAGNVHEVAGRAAPGARVVYADNDRCKSGCAHGYTVRT
jgi:S-adenosyl methyltransferase